MEHVSPTAKPEECVCRDAFFATASYVGTFVDAAACLFDAIKITLLCGFRFSVKYLQNTKRKRISKLFSIYLHILNIRIKLDVHIYTIRAQNKQKYS